MQGSAGAKILVLKRARFERERAACVCSTFCVCVLRSACACVFYFAIKTKLEDQAGGSWIQGARGLHRGLHEDRQ